MEGYVSSSELHVQGEMGGGCTQSIFLPFLTIHLSEGGLDRLAQQTLLW